jgi:biopolymer transport protein ExbB/TolQ
MVKGASVCPHCKLEQIPKNRQGFMGLVLKLARIYGIFLIVGLVIGVIGFFWAMKRIEASRSNFEETKIKMAAQAAKQDELFREQQAAADKQFKDAQSQFDQARLKNKVDMQKAREDARKNFDEARKNMGVNNP